MNRVWVGAAYVRLTASDGPTHLVVLRLYEEALVRGDGQYPTVCGQMVFAASMAAEGGRTCALCRAAVERST